jgi:hypothetical protein
VTGRADLLLPSSGCTHLFVAWRDPGDQRHR